MRTQVVHVTMGGTENTDQIIEKLFSSGMRVSIFISQRHFPIHPFFKRKVEVVILETYRKVKTQEEAFDILRQKGLEPPTYELAIRFAEQYGRQTTSDEKPFVPFLHGPTEHFLGLDRRVLCLYRGSNGHAFSLKLPGDVLPSSVLVGVRVRPQAPMLPIILPLAFASLGCLIGLSKVREVWESSR